MNSCCKQTTEPIPTVSKPFFSPAAGTYDSTQTVTISCVTLGVTIVYTTDGTDPVSSSTVYTSPILISTTTTVKAKAFRAGWIDSQTAIATYTINLPEVFVSVPGGTFTMGRTTGSGDSNELPTHQVTLNSFSICKYEVTQSEWQAIMGSNPANDYGVGDNYPVYSVSWYAVIKYSNLRSMNEGLTPVYSISGSTNPDNWGAVPTSDNTTWDAAICNWSANGYRLPTEAEWEYAARSATNTPDYLYSGSDDINAVAWYDLNNSPNGAKPVGGKAANGLDTYDMTGNVWEWCWDWYDSSYYSSSPANNPTGPGSGSFRLLRGGNWGSEAYRCRVSFRNYYNPYEPHINVGFRICRAN